jgi:hypothetical protein
MKSSFSKLLLFSVIAVHAFADSHPLPAIIPTQPPPEKPIAEYTVGDVLACNSVSDLPASHNYYAEKRYNEGLKENWPGAKIAAKIDAFCEIVLNAPEDTPPLQHLYDLKKATNNLHVVIREVMDVSDIQKVDALLRIVNAQTDPKKKKWAVDFASAFFIDVLDPRLLNLEKERLDDISIARRMVAEGIPDIEITARSEAKSRILRWLQDDLKITLDEPPFDVPDEAEACAAVKAWLDANAAMIATKCAEVKAKPDRKIPSYIITTWDAR